MRTAQVLEPWDRPRPLERMWCIWELYCATITESVVLDIVIGADEESRFNSALACEMYRIEDALRKSGNDAQGKPEDVARLKAIIAASGGMAAVDTAVQGRLQKWLQDSGERVLGDLTKGLNRFDGCASMEVSATAAAAQRNQDAKKLLQLFRSRCGVELDSTPPEVLKKALEDMLHEGAAAPPR